MDGHFGMSAAWILATKCTRVIITKQEMSVPTHLSSGDDLLAVIEANVSADFFRLALTKCTWSPQLRPRGRLLNVDEWGLTSPAW